MKFLYVRNSGAQLAIPASSVVGIYATAQRNISIYFNSLGTKNRNSGVISLNGIPVNSEDIYVDVVERLSKEIASDSGNMFVVLADSVSGDFFDKNITSATITLS